MSKDTPISLVGTVCRILLAAVFPVVCFSVSTAQTRIDEDIVYDKMGYAEVHAKRWLPQQSHFDRDFPGYDITYYGLNLDIDPARQWFNGFADLGIRMTEARQNLTIALAAPLTIDSVRAGSLRFTASNPDEQAFRVLTAPRTLPADTNLVIRIYYRGAPDQSYRSIVFSSHNGTPNVWTLSEPYGAMYWFPVRNVPSDKADSVSITVSVPSPLTAVSNGVLVSSTSSSGKNTFYWRSRYPTAMYLISLAIADYQYFEETFTWNGKTMPVVNYWYQSEDLEERRRQNQATMQQLALFSNQFGPYPFLNEKYGHARFTFGGGMEHQTISSMVNLSENLSAHELMHQWFGNAVTCASFEHIWFNEGFATFGEMLWIEHSRGKQAGIDWRSNRIATAATVPNNAIVWPEQAVAYANPAHINNIFNFRVSYVKAAIVVNMLRYVLGETAFNRAITKMVQEEFSGKSITTAQFQQFMERETGTDLSWFFQQWVAGAGHPDYAISWESALKQGNTYEVRIRVKQTTTSANVSFFRMPLEFRISGAAKDTTLRVQNIQSDQIFTVSIPFEPDLLVFDPAVHLLKGNVTLVKNSITETPGTLPKQFEIVLLYPNPFNPAARITFTLDKAATVRLRVTDMSGRSVMSRTLGGFIAGRHDIAFAPEPLSSGRYLLLLEAGNRTATKTFTVVK